MAHEGTCTPPPGPPRAMGQRHSPGKRTSPPGCRGGPSGPHGRSNYPGSARHGASEPWRPPASRIPPGQLPPRPGCGRSPVLKGVQKAQPGSVHTHSMCSHCRDELKRVMQGPGGQPFPMAPLCRHQGTGPLPAAREAVPQLQSCREGCRGHGGPLSPEAHWTPPTSQSAARYPHPSLDLVQFGASACL